MGNFPIPASAKEVQSFLGFHSYFRWFVKEFAHIAEPLTRLLRKGNHSSCVLDEEHAFKLLKGALTTSSVRAYFSQDLPTGVHTDASSYGIGAVNVQKLKGGVHVVPYASRTLPQAERNYSTSE